MKKRFWSMLWAAALLAAILTAALSAGAASDERVYFMGVNDSVLALNDETMPRVVNGVLYVPYTLFGGSGGDASLEVFSSYSRAKSTVMIYDRSLVMIFDLVAGNSTAGDRTFQDRAIIRNSMVFVPLDAVCSYFGLTWSRLTVDYGYIVRVCSDDAVLSDAAYTDAAFFSVRSQYNAYLQRRAAEAAPSAEPTTPATSTTPSGNGAQLYLGFDMEDGAGLDAIVGQLERYGTYGIFFCAPEGLAGRDDEIRALTAAGHRVGLLLTADTLAGQLAQAEEGRALLAHIARTEPTAYVSRGLTEPDLALLGEELTLWTTSLDATPQGRSVSRQAEAVIGSVRSNRRYFVLMDDSTQSGQALARILGTLTENGSDFRQPTEVALGGS